MLRLGLCCTFRDQPIKFRTTTAAYMQRKYIPDRLHYIFLSQLILDNVDALHRALQYCCAHNIGSFRINSAFLPLYTHPKVVYTLEQLPDVEKILEEMQRIKLFAKQKDVRLVLHPDQFVILNALDSQIIKNSVCELEYHGHLAELLGVDVINIHAGGVYGDKSSALQRPSNTITNELSDRVLQRLTLENDDKSYSPADLLPFCRQHKIPFVYDVHHHRCLTDDLSITQATEGAIQTWDREPLLHISSPKEGWSGKNKMSHHDFIDMADFPYEWHKLNNATIEVEAKAKELAVLQLKKELTAQGLSFWTYSS